MQHDEAGEQQSPMDERLRLIEMAIRYQQGQTGDPEMVRKVSDLENLRKIAAAGFTAALTLVERAIFNAAGVTTEQIREYFPNNFIITATDAPGEFRSPYYGDAGEDSA